MTRYAILRHQKIVGDVQIAGGAWVHVGTVEARGASSALREHLRVDEINGETADGEFVAVPTRSFKPVTVKVETKTALKFS